MERKQNLKRKFDFTEEGVVRENSRRLTLANDIARRIDLLNSVSSSLSDPDIGAAQNDLCFLSGYAKDEDIVDLMVVSGVVPALVKVLHMLSNVGDFDADTYDVEKDCVSILGHLAVKPDHQQLIVDAGALPCLVELLMRPKAPGVSQALFSSLLGRAADAITNLAHENINIKTLVRLEGGIPPLVDLLEFNDTKVQRAAAGALRTLAFQNAENKDQIVECDALPTLVLMLGSEDPAIHYEAVGVIGNLVHSSPEIKREVLLAEALQPVICLLSSPCLETQREAALLIGQFATTDSDCKIHIAQRGAIIPLIKMLKSPDLQLREMSTFALGRLAQDSHNQAGIAYNGGIEPLLNLLVTNNPSVQHNAAFALYALADNERRRLKKPVPAVETRLKIRIKTTAGRPPPVVINEPTEHEVIAKINNPSESDNSSSSAEIPVQDTAGTSKRIPTPVEDYDTFLNSEGDPTYRPTSVKGSFMSSADEVNQTSEPQHETIKEADEEEAVGNQEVTRVPLVDVQENEEESIPVAETEIERENVEIQEADGEEGFAEGNKILQALKQFQISLHKESQYQGKAQRRNLEELKSYKN